MTTIQQQAYKYEQLCVICDIDGTISNLSHRKYYLQSGIRDYKTFFELCHLDRPIVPMCKMVRNLMGRANVIFVTGRPESVREKTEKWLTNQGLKGRLIMRDGSIWNRNSEYKLGVLKALRKEGLNPTLAIDDDPDSVDMWAKNGVMCLQLIEKR